MGNLGEGIPKLGFGLMRLPHIDDDQQKPIDVDHTSEMVDLFLERGYKYFDTAFGYVGSEQAIRQALIERHPRDSFLLADKIPAWEAKSADEAKRMLDTSLERCGTDYFDFYLLHNIGGSRAPFFDEYGIWDFVAQKKDEGVLKHVGFSLHDNAQMLDDVLTAHPEMEFVQLQINYADWHDHAVQSKAVYDVAQKHGKPVVVMEPLRGGALTNLPEQVAKVFDDEGGGASQASWGLRFVASLPGVLTVLSGMSNIDQMRDNLAIMDAFEPLSDAEMAVIEHAQAELAKIPSIPCTDCRYCLDGCPVNMPISRIFEVMNSYLRFNNLTSSKYNYMFNTRDGVKASDCVGCGACEQVCTQHIHIIDELAKVAATLE